jgi:hypothetical protein
MSDRLPPAIAIFFSETIRRRVMPRIGARVSSVRYDPSSTIQSAFVEELSQAMSKAAERLRPDVAPALSVVLIADPMLPAPGAGILNLISKACPLHVEFVPQWIGIDRQQQGWPREGVTFLLSTVWRGGLIQGGALDRAYQSLILSVLATETSRVAPDEFDCFARLRFHSPGKVYKVAVDPIDLPDFDRDADQALRNSILASYFPEIDARAREAALKPAPNEPMLCAAIAQSATVAQAAAVLGSWSSYDLQAALTHWAVEAAGVDLSQAHTALAQPLFTAGGFPLLHELKPFPRSQQLFRNQASILRLQMIQQKRAELDRDYYELLPNDLNASQRLAVTAELAKANGTVARVTITRHFPSDLINDTREEILDLRGLSTVLYSMEMRPHNG